MVDRRATNNTIPLSIMEVLGLECTRYYEVGESVYVIVWGKNPAYAEIKYFCAWISSLPHIATLFNIIVVDLPTTHGIVLGHD